MIRARLVKLWHLVIALSDIAVLGLRKVWEYVKDFFRKQSRFIRLIKNHTDKPFPKNPKPMFENTAYMAALDQAHMHTVMENPIFYPSRHTMCSYRSQQRAAKARKRRRKHT